MNSLITVAQYQALLGLNNIPPPQIPMVETLIKVVSDMVENLIGYELELQERAEKTNKFIKNNRFWVRFSPITEVLELKINEKVIPATDYTHTKKKIEFSDKFYNENCSCIFTKEDTIELKYKAGYIFGDSGTVPYDLQYAVARMVQSLITIQQDPDMLKYSSYKINDISYTYKEAERLTVEAILLPALKGLMLWQ